MGHSLQRAGICHVDFGQLRCSHGRRGWTAAVAPGCPGLCQSWSGVCKSRCLIECRVDQAQYEALERALLAEIDLNADNLRFYRLTEPLAQHVKEFGVFRATDFEKDSLIV